MPELPDVEGFKRYFARHAKGKPVRGVTAPTPAILRNTTPQALGAALRGQALGAPARRGKWMLAPAGGPAMLFHFGMTGLFRWSGDATGRHRHDRLILHFDDGELRYRNMRMLGGVWLVRSGEDVEPVTGPLGPDAASLDRSDLEAVLADCHGGIKALLMNQKRVAGIGNELSDEVLWKAKIHPASDCAALSDGERRRLHRVIREVIATSNRHGRIPTEPRWLKSQRREREPRCPRCRAGLERSRIAGRTSFWCRRCQPPRGSRSS